MIEVKHISYSYGRQQVLKDISFSVQAGDCVGILGNNGAGKSTLVTCIDRIRKPDSGSVCIDGRDVFGMGRLEAARNIAYVAQKSEMSRTTVYDAVLLGRKPYMKWGSTGEDYALCDEMLEKVGMSPFKLRYINELSGGEAQKVMLARAFVQQPKLLLLDEPTSNLDPKNQYEMMRLVRGMAEERRIAVLVVIHDLNLALRCCNRFLFIKDGRVYRFGDGSAVTEQVLYDVYGIHAAIALHNGRKYAIIE